MARAGACFPGVLISAAARGLWNSEPALVTGKPTLSAPPEEKQPLLSCTERKSRLLLAKVQDKTAASFNAALIPCLRAVPPKLRQTLTLDNGSEMAGFRALEAATGLRTYFCKPHAPWQRGTNENSNGLLRQYFPRGISLHKITKKMLRNAAERPASASGPSAQGQQQQAGKHHQRAQTEHPPGGAAQDQQAEERQAQGNHKADRGIGNAGPLHQIRQHDAVIVEETGTDGMQKGAACGEQNECTGNACCRFF